MTNMSQEIWDLRLQDHAGQVRQLKEVWVGALADMAETGVVLPMPVMAEIEATLLKLGQLSDQR